MIEIIKNILEENGYRVYLKPRFKDLGIDFDLMAQNGDRLVIFEFISDERHAMSKLLELQGKAGQLKQRLGEGGKGIEIYAVYGVIVEVYEKLFRRFEEARQNSIVCRKLVLSIDSPLTTMDTEIKSKLEFDLLPLLPFDESAVELEHVEGLSILGDKLKDDVLITQLITTFQNGGSAALAHFIEQKLVGV